MEWYLSGDPFFGRYPRSTTPKIYRIAEAELSEHLKDAVRLRCDGPSYSRECPVRNVIVRFGNKRALTERIN